MNEDELQQKLLERIKARRANIVGYVGELEPRGARLTNLSIISSAVASALTAAPALGGERLTEGFQNLFGLPSDSVVWRSLCLAAMILSIVAAITTNLYKSNDLASRLTKAQAANALLEGLQTLVEFGQLPVAEAAKLYQQYIAEIPFIPEQV